MKKMFYPAVFHRAEEGGYWITFPDIPECITEGDNMEEAYNMAVDALGLALTDRIKEKQDLPKASEVDDIKEDGTVFVSSPDHDGVNEAIRIIEGLTKEVQAGEVYLGKVTKIAAFGAFIEILPNKEGLCHISKLDKKRVEKVEDVVSVGDEILVKVTEIDSQGRINLSRKDALPQEEVTE